MRRSIWMVVAFAVAQFGALPLLLAQAEPFMLSVTPQHSIFYPPDRWIPLRLEARNNTDREMEGYFGVPVRRPDGAGMELRIPVNLPPHSRVLRTGLAVFPPDAAGASPVAGKEAVSAVTTVELRSRGGARLSQQPLLARQLTAPDDSQYNLSAPAAMTLVLSSVNDDTAEAAEPSLFVPRVLQAAGGYASVVASQDEETFARHSAALDGVNVIVASQFDFNALDLAQREALLQHLRRGGTLVLHAPDPDMLESSWLAPYLPVQLIGRRLMDRITVGDGVTHAFRDHVQATEALAAGGEVVLADGDYVHAAIRPVGLGRLIFTSFPVYAFASDEEAISVWSRLLRNDAAPPGWDETALQTVEGKEGPARDRILSRMIGKQVAPWGLAAGVTAAYLVVVVGVQVVMNGVRRPGAFAVTLGIAALLSVVLAAMGLGRGTEQTPMAARIATIDIAGDGGGVMREVVAFVGRDEESFSLTAAGEDVTLRLMDGFSRGDQAVVTEFPFAAPEAGMRAASYQRVWSADGVLPTEMKMAASLRFGADGAIVQVDNGLGGSLQAPKVMWGQSVLPTAQSLAVGQTRTAVGGDDSGSMIVSGEDKLRSEVQEALLTRGNGIGVIASALTPRLVGFLEESAVPRLLTTSADEELAVRSVAMVRVPLRVEASEVGQRVRIPGELMVVEAGEGRGLPFFDMLNGVWLPSSDVLPPGWLIGFRPPQGVGELRPIRLSIDANFNAPRHRVMLYRQQVRDGAPSLNTDVEPVAKWETPVGARDAVIELNAGDADASGTVWLRLEVARSTAEESGLPAPWHIQWLRAGYEAEVVGPPRQETGPAASPAGKNGQVEE